MDRESTGGASDVIDWGIFGQILEMDEDDEHDFSKSIVQNYYEQAETTFADMEQALAANDLEKLSQLGHFLKGSSASLGLTKVQSACEDIQHLGANRNEAPLDKAGLEALIAQMRVDYNEIRAKLESFFNQGQ